MTRSEKRDTSNVGPPEGFVEVRNIGPGMTADEDQIVRQCRICKHWWKNVSPRMRHCPVCKRENARLRKRRQRDRDLEDALRINAKFEEMYLNDQPKGANQ